MDAVEQIVVLGDAVSEDCLSADRREFRSCIAQHDDRVRNRVHG